MPDWYYVAAAVLNQVFYTVHIRESRAVFPVRVLLGVTLALTYSIGPVVDCLPIRSCRTLSRAATLTVSSFEGYNLFSRRFNPQFYVEHWDIRSSTQLDEWRVKHDVFSTADLQDWCGSILLLLGIKIAWLFQTPQHHKCSSRACPNCRFAKRNARRKPRANLFRNSWKTRSYERFAYCDCTF